VRFSKQIKLMCLGIGALSSLIAIGCNQSLDARGPYQQKLVVYSILSARSDTSVVRVYTTYNPAGYDPLGNTTDADVPNASVVVTDDSSTYRLAQTVFPRVDKSRYTSDLIEYIAHPFNLRPGKAYHLAVGSSQGNATASVIVPGEGAINANNPFILKSPGKYTENIDATIYVTPPAFGYLVRIYVDYDVLVGQVLTHRRSEVPFSIAQVNGSDIQFNYPKLTRRGTGIGQPNINVSFSLAAYSAFFGTLTSQYGTNGFKITSATYIVTQVEENLYKYYNLANGFQDPYSIRTDLPDFSNITGGLGVFGAMVDDSVVVDLSN
jgi:hypothetical protein